MPKLCKHESLQPDTCRICFWCASCSREGKLYRERWGEPDPDCGPNHVEPKLWKETPVVNIAPEYVRREVAHPPVERKTPLLGDAIKETLSAIGITQERVSSWMGRECGCAARQEKMNKLDELVRRKASDGLEAAKGWFKKLIGDE